MLHGGGPDYRVQSEDGVVIFTPALGGAVQSQPLAFRFESVRRGGKTLIVAEPAAPSRAGKIVSYAHKGGVRERYEVRADGVHQTFVFDALPPGRGDLIVRGRITTGLPV